MPSTFFSTHGSECQPLCILHLNINKQQTNIRYQYHFRCIPSLKYTITSQRCSSGISTCIHLGTKGGVQRCLIQTKPSKHSHNSKSSVLLISRMGSSTISYMPQHLPSSWSFCSSNQRPGHVFCSRVVHK